MQKRFRALEFFSGIGAFAQAGHAYGAQIIEAYDQGEDANSVYKLNYGQTPCTKNLDSIKQDQIKEADLWWMSPPCLPYTRKGNSCDIEDARAKSFLNLIDLCEKILPARILLENVPEFKDSKAMNLLKETLERGKYQYKSFDLCSSQFGIPMLRRRFFLVASRTGRIHDIEMKAVSKKPLTDFLSDKAEADQSLYLSEDTLLKLDAFDIVDSNNPRVTCFTSSYGKQHKASGSVLRAKNNKIRYFAAEEILAMLGFSPDFKLPQNLSNQAKWRLVGNSVDTRVISLLLEASGI